MARRIAGIIYVRWKKLPLWKTADVLAPSIALGNVFGRIGCLLNGCCYGRACNLPWAIRFPSRRSTSIRLDAAPVHPTEIYDALLNFALYLGLAWLFRRKKFDGQVFATYLIGYAMFRSIVEYFRGDYPPDHIHNGLTSGQLVSIPIFIAGLMLAAMLSRRENQNEDRGWRIEDGKQSDFHPPSSILHPRPVLHRRPDRRRQIRNRPAPRGTARR